MKLTLKHDGFFLFLLLPAYCLGLYALGVILPGAFGISSPFKRGVSDVTPAKLMASQLTANAYLTACQVGLPGHLAKDYALNSQTDFNEAVRGSDLMCPDVKESTIKLNRRFNPYCQLHIKCFGSVNGVRYPIFTNDQIDDSIGTSDPTTVLSYLQVLVAVDN